MQQQQGGNTLTRTEVNRHAGKDTGHSKRLGEGVEGASPGDLPGSDVNQDEMELQQELTHLKQHKVRDTLASRHAKITKRMAKPKKTTRFLFHILNSFRSPYLFSPFSHVVK